MSYTKCGFAREVRLLLNDALLARSNNPAIIGVRVCSEQYPDEAILVIFSGKSDQQIRQEILNAVIEFMTRYPTAQDLSIQMSYDFGPFGNVMLSMWTLSTYWLTLPARLTKRALETWRF